MRFLDLRLIASSSSESEREDLFARFIARAQQHVKRRVATIVEDQVRALGNMKDLSR